MPIYEESGLRITLPDGESFRFQDCPSYQILNGKNLSEIDFGWWDASKDTLCLLEVKDYSGLSPSERLPQHLLDKLINKVTDTLMLLSSVWFASLQGQQICSDLPVSCQTFPIKPKKIKIVIILKINSDIKIRDELSPIKTRLKDKLLGRLQLFDIKHVTLVDHETAIKMPLPIEVI
ncbi:hypothetical protein [Nostoc sp. DSM 114167]|jgi:hypothetical protein|uniref:hypothetical protein n=1 Tax=Nostoc sp. DSM 114167 TaxID=3439050 RepID=UPI0040461A2E